MCCTLINKILKSRKGFILLEINLVLIFLLVIFTMFYSSFSNLNSSLSGVVANISFYNADRYTIGFIEKELSFHTSKANISKDTTGRKQVTCYDLSSGIKKRYYLKNHVIYRETSTATTVGINPISLAQAYILSWDITRIAENKIMITTIYRDTRTEREKEFTHLIRLVNGTIEEVN